MKALARTNVELPGSSSASDPAGCGGVKSTKIGRRLKRSNDQKESKLS
jgi:hypothetical protein